MTKKERDEYLYVMIAKHGLHGEFWVGNYHVRYFTPGGAKLIFELLDDHHTPDSSLFGLDLFLGTPNMLLETIDEGLARYCAG